MKLESLNSVKFQKIYSQSLKCVIGGDILGTRYKNGNADFYNTCSDLGNNPDGSIQDNPKDYADTKELAEKICEGPAV